MSDASGHGVLERIRIQRAVPVLRSADAEDAVSTARACARGGMSVIELTRSTPEVERAIAELAADPELLVGLGTVTSPEQVRAGVASGARFIVSFGFDPAVVEAARELDVAVVPGALTPTEVRRCANAGASAVKLFPARLIEPAYLRDLRAVMPGTELMVTGGIGASAEAIAPWLEAGALAIGLGSALGSAAKDGADEVERRCRALLDAGPS